MLATHHTLTSLRLLQLQALREQNEVGGNDFKVFKLENPNLPLKSWNLLLEVFE
jgi:hypothetical protein